MYREDCSPSIQTALLCLPRSTEHTLISTSSALWRPASSSTRQVPSRSRQLALPEAAIAIGVHYIDLADARRFVAGIGILDEAAKRAKVAVLSGASSTPALSHAVLDDLTKGWRHIDRILVAISPGNRAPRGKSVIAAILSYSGHAIRVFRDGGWEDTTGWSGNEKIELPDIGKRNVVLMRDIRSRPAGQPLPSTRRGGVQGRTRTRHPPSWPAVSLCACQNGRGAFARTFLRATPQDRIVVHAVRQRHGRYAGRGDWPGWRGQGAQSRLDNLRRRRERDPMCRLFPPPVSLRK